MGVAEEEVKIPTRKCGEWGTLRLRLGTHLDGWMRREN